MKMREIHRKLISVVIFLVLTFGIMIPLYIHYTAQRYPGAYDILYISDHSQYDTILIEVHYREGSGPSDISLGLLKDRVETYTGKPTSIVKYPDIGDDEIPGIVNDIDVNHFGGRILKNHTEYRTGWLSGRIVLYIIYTGAQWSGENDFSAAGITYAADSIMIFKNVIHTPEIESSVLLHEMGHIWGLEHSNNSDDIMNIHLEKYLFSHGFNGLPNDFSKKDIDILLKKKGSWIILPVKPYEPLFR